MKKQFRDFESAREFVRNLRLRSNAEWRKYWKSHNKPDNIPAAPERTYKNEWKGWGDFLGTGNVYEKKWRSFEDARKFAHTLELNTINEWVKFTQSNRRPEDIPVHPERAYKNEFQGMGDFLGTGKTRNFRPYKEAREFVRSLKLKGQKEWKEYCKSENRPNDIPSSPREVYKKDFKGFGDWLGTGNISNRNRAYRPFKEAREFTQSLNFKSRKDWEKYSKSGQKPEDIPFVPRRTYKNEFKGWGDWLGTGNIADKDRVYRPFKEAREFVRSLNLKGQKEWKEYCKSGNKPDDIPSNPWNTYKE
jgi:hypothetical protein